MEEKEARRLCIDLMEIAEVAILTTVDPDGFPHTRAMFNLRRKEQFPELSELFRKQHDDFPIYFTTNTSSSKIAHIKRNFKVSVYYSKPSEWRGLMLGGEVEIVKDGKIKEELWQKGWERYYPGGPHDPDHTVLRLLPRFARYYHQLNFVNFNLK